MKLKHKIFFFFLLFPFSLFSQSASPGGSVRLTVLAGGNLDFVFNSISAYKNGITYTDWTVIGITVTDSVAAPDYLTWTLEVEALDADLSGGITGSVPANTIPFSAIEIIANPVGAGCAACNFSFPVAPGTPLPPPGGGVVIVDDGGGVPPNLSYVTDQVSITYRCGVGLGNSLLGYAADYYTEDIVFTLEMQ